MIRLLVALLCSLVDPRVHQLASGILATDAVDVSTAEAAEHAWAAVVAADVVGGDPALLLSIAWHESRYHATERTPEVGGKVSCGVMTPEPGRSCPAATMTVLGGYLAGAEHLRGWMVACRGHEHCALLGYAGGGRLIRLCQDQPDLRACQTPRVFLGRAAMIAAERRPRS